MNKPPRRSRTAKRPPSLSVREVELEILSLAAKGDGVARLEGQTVYVPFTTPGDRVRARLESRRGDALAAAVVELLVPGPLRADPPCPHFGRCGGCAAQHMGDGTYLAWKPAILADALAHQGLGDAELRPLVRIPPGRRRRAAFALHRGAGGVSLGFNARASHTVIDIGPCPLLAPDLVALLPALRPLLAELAAPGTGSVTVTLTDGGPDVLVEAEVNGKDGLGLAQRERLAAFAAEVGLARLHWRRPSDGFAEPIARHRPAEVSFAGIAVEPPPGAFLQPSPEGEAAIAALVMAAMPVGDGAVADLYAGCGSFSLPLARTRPVHAVEGEQAALAALDAAARNAGLPVAVEVRDLARRPLAPHDLVRFSAVVMDPPRAGAAAQAEDLARPRDPKGGPSVLVMVSCNPATLARDLRILVDGGWRLGPVTPIDQFPWSPHLEVVAVLHR